MQLTAAKALTTTTLRGGPADPVAATLAAGTVPAGLIWHLACWFANHGDRPRLAWALHGGNEGRDWAATQVAVHMVKAAGSPVSLDDLTAQTSRNITKELDNQERKLTAHLDGGGTLADYDREAADARMTKLLAAPGYRAALHGSGEVLGADEAGAFDPKRMTNWLNSYGARSAYAMNESTNQGLAKAMGADDTRAEVKAVFDRARGQADGNAQGWVTTARNFGGDEAAKATNRSHKEWLTGPRPRPSHAKLDGSQVALFAKFPNGAKWPGDPYLPVHERAGCNCFVRYHKAQPLPRPEPPEPKPGRAVKPRADTVPVVRGLGKAGDVQAQRQEQVRGAIRKGLEGINPRRQGRLRQINAEVPMVEAGMKAATTAFYRPSTNEISLGNHMWRDDFEARSLVDHRSRDRAPRVEIDDRPTPGWHPPIDKGVTAVEATVTHELGHFLDFNLSGNQRRALRSRVYTAAREAGVRGRTNEELLPAMRGKGLISEYAATDPEEMIAEAWCEYKLNSQPGLVARTVGQYIMEAMG